MDKRRETSLGEAADELNFARASARHFAEHPACSTRGDCTPGSLLAIRWGMMDRGVLVVKLDDNHQPQNYVDAVAAFTPETAAVGSQVSSSSGGCAVRAAACGATLYRDGDTVRLCTRVFGHRGACGSS